MAHALAPADEASSLRLALERILPEVPEALLDGAAKDVLLNAAPALPYALARHQLGLEFRLQGAAGAELFVAAVPSRSDAELLRRSLLGGAVGPGSVAAGLASAVEEWRRAGSWLGRSCAFLLLGYDGAAATNDAAAAAADDAAAPTSAYLAPREGAPPALNAFHTDPFGMLSALSAIADVPLGYRTCADLKALMDGLPPRAQMFAGGTVLSRDGTPARRVAFRHVRGSEVGPFVKRANRTRAARTLGRAARSLAGVSPDMCVALDLDPDGADAAELRVAAPGTSAGWAALLDVLVRRKLADPDRAAAALRLIEDGEGGRSTVAPRHVKVTATAHAFAPTRICVGYGGLR